MAKKTFEATFYYQVTLVREGKLTLEVPDNAADDFNPLAGKPVAQILREYEGELGEAEMLVDDENPEGERLTDILLHHQDTDSYVRATRIEGNPNLVDAPVDLDEDEE